MAENVSASGSGGWHKVDGKWVKSTATAPAKFAGFKPLDWNAEPSLGETGVTPEGVTPDVKKVTPGTKLRVRSNLTESKDKSGSYAYSVKGAQHQSVYPGWVKPGCLLVVMTSDSDYWVRCQLYTKDATNSKTPTWYFPYTDLVTTNFSPDTALKPPPPPTHLKTKPKPFVSQISEAEKLIQEMLQLSGQCATDLSSTALLNDPYKEQKTAMLWTEQVDSLQAQLVGWSMDLQERLEDAQLAIEKGEFEEIRKNATLDFFAGDADY